MVQCRKPLSQQDSNVFTHLVDMVVYLVYFTNNSDYLEDRNEFVDEIFIREEDANHYASQRRASFLNRRDENTRHNEDWYVVSREVISSLY